MTVTFGDLTLRWDMKMSSKHGALATRRQIQQQPVRSCQSWHRRHTLLVDTHTVQCQDNVFFLSFASEHQHTEFQINLSQLWG